MAPPCPNVSAVSRTHMTPTPQTKLSIPSDVKAEVQILVEAFNRDSAKHQREVLSRSDPKNIAYVARFRGRYLYLDQQESPTHLMPICRLMWQGDMDDWEADIYRYSQKRYEFYDVVFPGADELDGTVTGAMRAGLKAYPD